MKTTPIETKTLLGKECVATILNNRCETIARIRGNVELNNGIYSVRPKPMDGSLDTVVWLKETCNVDTETYTLPQIVIH
jgi:hypothetical protein